MNLFEIINLIVAITQLIIDLINLIMSLRS